MFQELKNLSLDIKNLQLQRLTEKEFLINLEEKKAEILKTLADVELQAENEILLGENALLYKNDKARKAAIKAILEVDYDYIKYSDRLSEKIKEIKKAELDLKKGQIEIDFISREYSIYLALANNQAVAA